MQEPPAEEATYLTGMQKGIVWLVQMHQRSRGSVDQVEVSWRAVLEREERVGDVRGFYHTHPRGAGTLPSERDVRTMQAWCIALGKPLLCVIGCDEEVQGYTFSQTGFYAALLQVVVVAGQVLVAVEHPPRPLVKPALTVPPARRRRWVNKQRQEEPRAH